MLRIIGIIFILLFLTVTGAGYSVYSRNFERFYPVDYKLSIDSYSADSIAENTDVLIVGDKFGEIVSGRIATIIDEASKTLQRPLQIYNLSSPNEGIHRTIFKLKKLKKLPPVIIYMGGTSEFYENIFPENLVAATFNFNLFKNDYIQSALRVFPILSRFIYMPTKHRVLTDEITPSGNYSSAWFQKISEITFYLYQHQLSELIDNIYEAQSTPILITPALNLLRKVEKVCEGSVTDDITIGQVKVKKMLDSGEIKDAYNETLLLDGISIANAQTKYLLGVERLKLGKFKKAKENLIMAKAIDCNPKGAHPVINSIIRNVAKEKSVEFIDFDLILNEQLGKNELFISDDVPQFIFQEKLEKEIILKIKEAFRI